MRRALISWAIGGLFGIAMFAAITFIDSKPLRRAIHEFPELPWRPERPQP